MTTTIHVRQTRPRRLRQVIGTLLSAVVMTGFIGLALFALATRFNVLGAWDVETGSMVGYANPGDLVLTHDVQAPDLHKGDVITVPKPRSLGGRPGEVVTHRIDSIEHHGLTATIVVKGDRNRSADPFRYDLGHAQRAFRVIPQIGPEAFWAFHRGLIYLVTAFVAGVIAYLGWRRSSERYDASVVTVHDDAVTDDADVQSDVDPALLAEVRGLIKPAR